MSGERSTDGTRQSWWTAGAFVAVVVAYALLSRVWTDTDSAWYSALEKPAFQPPDVVFGIIWPLNFLALAVVGILVSRSHPRVAERALRLLMLSVAFALGWSYLFSQQRLLTLSAASLVLAAAVTWLLLVVLARARLGYGAGLLVYACWMTLAAALSTSIAVLN